MLTMVDAVLSSAWRHIDDTVSELEFLNRRSACTLTTERRCADRRCASAPTIKLNIVETVACRRCWPRNIVGMEVSRRYDPKIVETEPYRRYRVHIQGFAGTGF